MLKVPHYATLTLSQLENNDGHKATKGKDSFYLLWSLFFQEVWNLEANLQWCDEG